MGIIMYSTDLDSARQLRKQLSVMVDNLSEAIYRLEESEMDVEEGKEPDPCLWAFLEIVECVKRKVLL